MGTSACAAIKGDAELELGAQIGRGDAPEFAGHDVVLELSTPSSVRGNTIAALTEGVPVVVGATGLSASDLRDIEAAAKSHSAAALVIPNFALGAVLMMRFAQQAARFFDRAEIIERHHEKKLDAPSGTARRTAELMNETHAGPWGEIAGDDGSGARGEDVDGVHIHSLRLPGSVAHQEVLFGAPGEVLTIKHDSLDRSSFMPGILLAVKAVPEMSGLTVGLEHLLDL
jgi:4-hydroxy-tetrahydrodipicolinate reductase